MKRKRTLAKSVDKVTPPFDLRTFLRKDHSFLRRLPGEDELAARFLKMFPARAEPGSVQEALEYNYLINGGIKSNRMAFLRLGRLMVYVRDNRLFLKLNHPNMEDYAWEHLTLGKTQLYKYLNAYDWVFEKHKDWLAPHPKGYIPDLSDLDAILWLEKRIASNDINDTTRAELKELLKKALEGKLRKGEIDPYRKKKHDGDDNLKSFLSQLRRLRKRGSEMKAMPTTVITDLDHAIEELSAVRSRKRKQRFSHHV